MEQMTDTAQGVADTVSNVAGSLWGGATKVGSDVAATADAVSQDLGGAPQPEPVDPVATQDADPEMMPLPIDQAA
jgi:hypothetical protein